MQPKPIIPGVLVAAIFVVLASSMYAQQSNTSVNETNNSNLSAALGANETANLTLLTNDTAFLEESNNSVQNNSIESNQSEETFELDESIEPGIVAPKAKIYSMGEFYEVELTSTSEGYALFFSPSEERGSEDLSGSSTPTTISDTPSIKIEGIKEPENLIVEIGEGQEDQPLTTPIVASDIDEFGTAMITLPKNGIVNIILRCENFDLEDFECEGSWKETNIPFVDNGDTITFSVDEFSGYGGSHITILNIHSNPVVGGNWEVRFRTFGIADLVITPVHGTRFEIDLEFLELKCGDEVRGADYDGQRVLFESWECSDEAQEINRVLTSRPHTLLFQFGLAFAYAYNFIAQAPWVWSWNSLGGDIVSTFRTNDTTPTVNFTTYKDANCRIDVTEGGYDDMTENCIGGQTTRFHICTVAAASAYASDGSDDGLHKLFVACQDIPAPFNQSKGNLTFTLDTTEPNITISSPISNYNYTTGSIELNITVDDPVSSCWYDVTGTNISMDYENRWTKDTVDNDAGDIVSSVAIGDSNDTGWNVIVIGTMGQDIYLYENVSGSWIKGTVAEDIGGDILSLAVGDVDDDGDNEIVVGLDTEKVYFYDINSSGLWENKTIDSSVGDKVLSLDLGDVDNDNDSEVVIGTEGDAVIVYEGENNTWTKYIVNSSVGGNVRSIDIGDADDNGLNEIVVAAGEYVMMFNGSDNLWTTNTVADYSGPVKTILSAVIGDVNNDEDNEIIAGTDVVYMYEGSGSTWTEYTVDNSPSGNVRSLFVGDPEDDNKYEIVAGTTNNVIYLYNYSTGTTWTRFDVDSNAGGRIYSIVVGDANNDGLNEIVVGTDQNKVIAYNGTHRIWYAFLNLPDSRYNVTVYCNNSAGLTGNSTQPFAVDLVSPSITLNYPTGGVRIANTTIDFNFTATDTVAYNMTCNLTVDSSVDQSNIKVYNGLPRIVQVQNLLEGGHTWSVTCWDNVSRSNTSVTETFTIDFQPPWIVEWVSLGNDTTYPFRTNLSSPLINFTTNELAYCRVNNTVGNYTEMGPGAQCILGEGAKSHICQAPVATGDGVKTTYITCNDTVGNADNSTQYDVLSYYLDTTPPVISFISPTPNETFPYSTIWINVSINESASACWYNITGDINTSGTLGYVSEWTEDLVNSGLLGGDVKSVDVGDVDNDYDNEIVVGTSGESIYIFYGFYGSWSNNSVAYGVGGSVNNTVIGDVDNDGKNEIVVSIGTTNDIYYYENETGSWVGYMIADLSGEIYDLAVGDADNNGFNELVVGIGNNVYLYTLSGGEWIGQQVNTNPYSQPVWSVAIGDPDNNGLNEIVVGIGFREDNLFVLNGSGSSWTETSIYDDCGGRVKSIAIGDSDNDGKKEIVVGTTAERICVYEKNGAWSSSLVDFGIGSILTSVDIGDANDDGRNDILAILENGNILLYTYLTSWDQFTVSSGLGDNPAGLVADVDNDLQNEIIVGFDNTQNLYVLNDSSRFWNARPTLGIGNFTVTVFCNDTVGLQNSSNQSFEIVGANRLPTLPQPLISPLNGSMELFYNVSFNWTTSTDPDGNNVTYELLVANDTSFNSTYIELNITEIDDSNYSTLNTGNNLSNGTKYWRVRACDYLNCTSWTYYNYFISVYAAINITNPLNNTVIRPNTNITLLVSEILRGRWIDLVNLTILGVEYSMVGDPNWQYNWTVPNIGPQIIEVVARGYNSTYPDRDAYAIDRIYLLLSRANSSVVDNPNILYLCANTTYALNNSNITIMLVADLDTLSKSVTLNVTTPSGSTIYVDYDSYASRNLTYYYNFTFELNETGTYNMSALIEDVENQTDSIDSWFVSTLVTKNLNFTANNVDMIELRDICHHGPIAYGTTIQKVVADGIYDLWLGVSQISTYDIQMYFPSLEANESWVNVLNYTFMAKRLLPPENKSGVILFQARPNLSYTQYNVTYNYTIINFTILNESTIEMYNCPYMSGCVGFWENLTRWLNTSADIVIGSLVGVSQANLIYVVEDQLLGQNITYNITQNITNVTQNVTNVTNITVTMNVTNVTETITRTVTQEVEVEVEKVVNQTIEVPKEVPVYYSIQLITPVYETLYWNDTISIPLIVRNPEEKTRLENIYVSATSDNVNLSVSLDRNHINVLNPLDWEIFNLTLRSGILITPILEPIRYSVNISADVVNPDFDDYTMIYVDVLPRLIGTESDIKSKVEFARELFRANPRCLEFSETVDEAVLALNTGRYEKANFLLDSAIDGCRELLSIPVERIIRIPQLIAGDSTPWIALGLVVGTIVSLLGIQLFGAYARRSQRGGGRRPTRGRGIGYVVGKNVRKVTRMIQRALRGR